MNRLLLPFLLSACLLLGGGVARAVDAESAESPLANTGDCYIALHQLDDPYLYDPHEGPSARDYLHKIVLDARYYLDIRPAAFAECEAALAAGDASSGYWLGEYLYANERAEEALPYYEKAAEMGDVRAIYFLGLAHLFGRYGLLIEDADNGQSIIQQDIDKGLEYIKHAADMGYGRAQFMYAHVYDRVKSLVERDLPRAWDYYQRAAESGDTSALLKVGALYLHYGASGECAAWKTRFGTDEFHKESQRVYAEEYAELGIECDVEKGLGYLKQAAMLGNTDAISILARLHEQRGETEEALKWHTLLWEWRYTDIFHMKSAPYSPSSVFYEPDYQLLCEDQHVSQEYIEGVKADGGLEKIAAAETWAAETKAGFPDQHCRYSDYSWHYQCRN